MCDDDLREQLKISKEFLEYSHGVALRYGTPDEAEAYYESITLLEDALKDAWDPEKADCKSDHWREMAAASRAAREEGYEAATRHDEAIQQQREKYRSPSVFDRLLPWRTAGGD